MKNNKSERKSLFKRVKDLFKSLRRNDKLDGKHTKYYVQKNTRINSEKAIYLSSIEDIRAGKGLKPIKTINHSIHPKKTGGRRYAKRTFNVSNRLAYPKMIDKSNDN